MMSSSRARSAASTRRAASAISPPWTVYDGRNVDSLEYVGQHDAEEMTRRLAREEGIFCGISSGGALAVALRISQRVENATIAFIVCDRGDRYFSTGVFPV